MNDSKVNGHNNGHSNGHSNGQNFKIILSNEGKELADKLVKLWPLPVLLQGPTGTGKSVLARYLSQQRSQPYSAINAQPGMDLNLLMGLWIPESGSNGITVNWQNGMLSESIRSGGIFLFEELTRAPQEAVSRLFGLMDNGFRYWSLPEAGNLELDVHPDFWFIATANPAGQGYQSTKLDRAFESRFAAIVTIDKPIAGELAILLDLVDSNTANMLMRFASDCRSNVETYLNTRDLVLTAELIKRGLDFHNAVEWTVAPKYGAHADGIKMLAEAHREADARQEQVKG